MDSGPPRYPEPRHSNRDPRTRRGGAIRNLVGVTAIGAAAFLLASFLDGDQQLLGRLDIRIGPGAVQPGSGQPATGQTGTAQPGPGQPATGHPLTGDSAAAPPPGLEEEAAPLVLPEPPAVESDSYAFLAVNGDGTPVGYSPCRPLHYVVNAAQVPAGAQQLIPDAIDTISRATGIRFIYDGATDEQPSPQRAPYQPEAYGDRWAPLLIAWTTPDVAPQLKGQVIGTGGSTHYSFDDGPQTFVTGSLELDAPQIGEELRRPDGQLYATAVILHELSHVMGLEHVDDPRQLMYPEIGTPEGLAPGDLNGLFELSKAQCRKDL